jgi:hypothetical protein
MSAVIPHTGRDLGAVLHAPIARSEQMGEIVASHGLTGLY